MAEQIIKFKTSLIFWKLYESDLEFTNEEVKWLLENSSYKNQLYDGYYFENDEGKRMPLKWIAATGHLYMPQTLKFGEDTFKCRENLEIHGKIQIDGHLYPQGVLVVQARLDFSNYMEIERLIIASIPDNVIMSDGINMKEKLDYFASEFLNGFLKKHIKAGIQTTKEKASPWHHNWIWWDCDPKIPINEFEPQGKYFKWALGMCTRSDKWRELNTENYSKEIENVPNLSPYYGNCVYITHPGNCIIPSSSFKDPNAVKNTLIDVLFAAELGNVQRYLILTHLQDFNFKSLEVWKLIHDRRYKDLKLKDLIKNLEDLEDEVNELVLEINKDLQITRTNRLIFTSVYKTKIFRQMIHALHGDDFYEGLQKLIVELKDSLTQERDALNTKAAEEENVFLRNLQVVFIIGLVAQMITLFYAVDDFAFDLGTIFVLVSVAVSIIILLILRKIR
ncbi:MAG: hypothetical protein EAX96_02285 [Candidatus Lokiarchaeota archaeon]|nr:hypothetical protein [Candidatus Lokiarchaeota archaeon]